MTGLHLVDRQLFSMSRNRSHLPHTRRRHNRPHRHSCLFQPKTKIGWCKCLLLIWKHRLWSSCLLVVELKRSEVFPRLWELSLLHPLPNKPESWLLNGRQARKGCAGLPKCKTLPVNERPLCVHQVKLMVKPEKSRWLLANVKISIYERHLAQASMMAVVLERQHTAL